MTLGTQSHEGCGVKATAATATRLMLVADTETAMLQLGLASPLACSARQPLQAPTIGVTATGTARDVATMTRTTTMNRARASIRDRATTTVGNEKPGVIRAFSFAAGFLRVSVGRPRRVPRERALPFATKERSTCRRLSHH